ncbi:MAG: septal ring lytic transglycosylase RlpA family protein [Gammaproteobacteria bacterium]|jgi:rare lipoprotein A|nr:septal ring lytic transglycosylase RlpA family protein [Gammaproteobacteria bacterium]
MVRHALIPLDPSLPLPRWGWLILALLLAVAAGCSSLPSRPVAEPSDGPPDRHIDVALLQDAVPRAEPRSRYGNPESYVVYDRRYQVMSDSAGYVERGIASWYGSKFHGRRTSSGEPFDMYAMTAAHTSLPLPTYAEVTNLTNGRKIIVKINDRGPFKHNRLIDLSYAAALKLGIAEQGTGLVEVRAIDPLTWGKAPAATTAASAVPALYLQAGAFSQMENAQRLSSRIQSATATGIRIVPADAANPLHRVRIGPLNDVSEADRLSRELLAQGVDTHVVLD